MSDSRLGIGLVAALAVAGLAGSVYTLDAREVAVVTLFGAPVRTVLEPGLYLRAPWPLHEVVRFDRRARLLDVAPAELLTADKKNLVVEAFVVWRVSDPERFLETVGAEEAAETWLSDLVVSRVAAGLGQREFSDLMNVEASAQDLLPSDVLKDVARIALERLGVQVLDVRLRHLGLPLQNEQSIYERMRAERSRIANAYRSEGEEKAASIRAEAERKAAEILASAERESASIEAGAEAAASRLYAESYRKDPEFYRFLRQQEALRAVLDQDTTLVVDANSPLFRALQEAPR